MRRQLHHRMVRIPRAERERLQAQSLRWSVPQQTIARVGLDDVLLALRGAKRRADVPAEISRQPQAPKYSTGDARKVLVNLYLMPEQETELQGAVKRLKLPASNIARAAVSRAVDELEQLDPAAGALPARYQRQILPDSYGGFATSVKRATATSKPPKIDHVKVALTDGEMQRLSRIARRFKLPLAVVARRAIGRELDDLERVRRADDLPEEYRDAQLRGTRFTAPRRGAKSRRRR
jgi:predicted DNA-binding protein